MTRIRRDTQDSGIHALQRPLRIVASGTLFLTHTLSLPTHPEPSSVIRASAVTRSRGGSASTCLSILAQFPSVEAILVAPLGGNDDGQRIIRDLEEERVSTRFCKIWEDAGVPSAWVLHADDTDSRTVINNNPLPDISHEDFVSILGPLLAPENYAYLTPTSSNTNPPSLQPRPSLSSMHATPHAMVRPGFADRTNINSPAPFDWFHFEGRSVKTTLSNIMGLESLARERKWRSHCVFSIDVGRRARQGVEALIPFADVLFLNKHYARAHSPQYAASPRAFLLSLISLVPPHALLVAHWGEDGAAVLSVPSREYFQSSGWVGMDNQGSLPEVSAHSMGTGVLHNDRDGEAREEVLSVRTESDFWAGQHTDSSSIFTAGMSSPSMSTTNPSSASPEPRSRAISAPRRQPRPRGSRGEDSSDSEGTQIAHGHSGQDVSGRGGQGGRGTPPAAAPGDSDSANAIDNVGAQDAFVAGMMFALSRRMLPGEPYTPSSIGRNGDFAAQNEREKGRWRLEECLRFATELAGRKARRKGWDGLAEEMARAGWFES